MEIDCLVKDLELKIKETDLKMTRVSKYGTQGAASSYSKEDGSLFLLKEAVEASLLDTVVIGRFKIGNGMLKHLSNPMDYEHFMEDIRQEMQSQGCICYTFSRPDGDSYLTHLEDTDGVELRAWGYKNE